MCLTRYEYETQTVEEMFSDFIIKSKVPTWTLLKAYMGTLVFLGKWDISHVFFIYEFFSYLYIKHDI